MTKYRIKNEPDAYYDWWYAEKWNWWHLFWVYVPSTMSTNQKDATLKLEKYLERKKTQKVFPYIPNESTN